MRTLFLLFMIGYCGCGSEFADGGSGFMCEGGLTPLGASPTDGEQAVATDAHPSVIWGNTSGCPLRYGEASPVVVKLAGQPIDGAAQVSKEGDSALSTFVPASPLVPNTTYVIESGTFTAKFTTGTTTVSPPPAPTTVTLVKPTFSDANTQYVEVRSSFGGSAPIIHFSATDSKGKASTAKHANDLAFVVPGATPVGNNEGAFGLGDIDQLCFVARTENEAGVLSPPSTPLCATPNGK